MQTKLFEDTAIWLQARPSGLCAFTGVIADSYDGLVLVTKQLCFVAVIVVINLKKSVLKYRAFILHYGGREKGKRGKVKRLIYLAFSLPLSPVFSPCNLQARQ